MSFHLMFWPERFSHILRSLLPYGCFVLFFALDVISYQMPPFGSIRPSLTLMAIFCWSIYRPALVPSWLVFLIGLSMDVVVNTPLGLSAIIYLMVSWIITDQRRFFVGQSFFTIMTGFCLVLILSNILRWGVFGLLNFSWPPLLPVAGSIILALFVFPIVNILLHMVHKVLPYQKPGVSTPV